MLKNSLLLSILFLTAIQLKAQVALNRDTTRLIKEVVVTYQAGKLTPVTFQNISEKDLKAKSTGQDHLICF